MRNLNRFDKNPRTGEGVEKNSPDAPEPTVPAAEKPAAFTEDEYKQIRFRFNGYIRNPEVHIEFSLEELGALAKDPNPWIRLNVARYPSYYTTEMLTMLLNDTDVNVCLATLNRTDIPSWMVEGCIDHPDRRVRLGVLKSDKINPELRFMFVDDEDVRIRLALLDFEDLSPDVFTVLAKDEDLRVIDKVLRHKAVTPEAVLILTKNKREFIRHDAEEMLDAMTSGTAH